MFYIFLKAGASVDAVHERVNKCFYVCVCVPSYRLFLGTDATASTATSSPVRETARSPPAGSSGESMDSVSVSSSDSGPSDTEGMTPTHTLHSQMNKVHNLSFS